MDEARRRWLVESMMTECSLEHVAEAIAAHGRPGREVYVEQRQVGYRWSPTHGSAYPLHREVALTIDVDYHRFVLPFITVDGRAVLLAEALAESDVVTSAFIESTTDAVENSERIRSALENGPRRTAQT